MEIYVNGNKIDYKPMFPLTWGNLIQKLLQNGNYIPDDHGIVEINVDGAESLYVMTEQSEKMVPEAIATIKISTKNSLDITRDGFSKVITLLESIKKEIGKTADPTGKEKLTPPLPKWVTSWKRLNPWSISSTPWA